MNCHLFYESQNQKNEYYDKRSKLSREEYNKKLSQSTTLYIGNLSIYTTEEKMWQIFGAFGPVKTVILGLNKKSFRPCGFGFVQFHLREHAEIAVNYMNKQYVDGNRIKIDFDIGFSQGRQFGRGYSGGQVIDEHKNQDYYQRPNNGGYRRRQINQIYL